MEWVGTLALALCGVLFALIAFYLRRAHKAQGGELVEDLPDSTVDEGADLGFYSPWSWWPLTIAFAIGLFFLGLAVGGVALLHRCHANLRGPGGLGARVLPRQLCPRLNTQCAGRPRFSRSRRSRFTEFRSRLGILTGAQVPQLQFLREMGPRERVT